MTTTDILCRNEAAHRLEATPPKAIIMLGQRPHWAFCGPCYDKIVDEGKPDFQTTNQCPCWVNGICPCCGTGHDRAGSRYAAWSSENQDGEGHGTECGHYHMTINSAENCEIRMRRAGSQGEEGRPKVTKIVVAGSGHHHVNDVRDVFIGGL